ncbi:hypothetical protein [Mycoplasma sp. 125]|uniref:hypothetical protein n=1 Tax=Mycoplasma sp. 125 TaxID=3447505 RepID=UPI003F65CA35
MKKSKLLFLGFLPVLATPVIALSCANPAKPENPEKPAEPKKPENPETKKPETPNEDKNQQFGDNIKIVYEDLKKHHSKEVLTDLIKQNKPIKDLLIKNAIKLDSVDLINTNNNLINNIKNEAPKIEIDYNDPSNDEIKRIIDTFFNKYLYNKYDKMKEGKGQRFGFSIDNSHNNKDITIHNDNLYDTEVPKDEPELNVPWDEDDEPSQMQTKPKTESKQKQEQKSESTSSKKETIINEDTKWGDLYNLFSGGIQGHAPIIDIYDIPGGKK